MHSVSSPSDFQAKLLAWFSANSRRLPWRADYEPYQVWISEVMLQQTQMDRAVDYFTRWIDRFPDVAAVTSSGSEVDVHEFSGTVGNLHHQLVTYWDNSISKVLKGQTLTSDIGNVGSRAASQTHYDVLEDLAAADSVLVEAFCNELGFVYRQINATPDTLAPCFSYEHPEDLASLAELDAKLYEQGVRYKAGYYARVYGRKEEEFTVVADTVVADTAPSAEAASFAAPLLAKDGEAEIAAQAEIDALADALLRDAPRLGQSLAADLVQTLSRAETFDDAQILLAEALCQAEGTNEFETVLAAGMRAAHLAGQSAVKKAQVL